MTNIPLLIFDLILLPLTLLRCLLIYLYGSKYGIKGLRFLDVIMHANNPYFNQDNDLTIDTEENDIRVVIRDDTRIYPQDIKTAVEESKENKDIIMTILNKNTNDTKVNENDNNNIIESKMQNNKNENSERELDEEVSEFKPGITHFGKYDTVQEEENKNNTITIDPEGSDDDSTSSDNTSDGNGSSDTKSESGSDSDNDEIDNTDDNTDDETDDNTDDETEEDNIETNDTDTLQQTASYATKDALNKVMSEFMVNLDK